jgi:spermidine synthase
MPIFTPVPRLLYRLLSHLQPVRLERAEGRHGPLELACEQGRPVVNSAGANQSFGSLHRVWRDALDHFVPHGRPPRQVPVVGLGAGSVVHILRAERGIDAAITAVEDDTLMVRWGRTHFGLSAWPHLTLLEADAREALAGLKDRYDLVLVDLFTDLDVPERAGTDAFLDLLRTCTAEGGLLLFNTIPHDPMGRATSERIGAGLRLRFGRVEEQGYEGLNRMFIAR